MAIRLTKYSVNSQAGPWPTQQKSAVQVKRTRGLGVAGRRLLRNPTVGLLLLPRRPAAAASRVEGHRRRRRVRHGLRTRDRRRLLRGSCRQLRRRRLRGQGGLLRKLLLLLRRQRLLHGWCAGWWPRGEGRLILGDGRLRLRRVRRRRRAGRRQRFAALVTQIIIILTLDI